MPHRILVAGPDPAGLDELCRIMDGEGHQTTRASSGLECLHRLASGRFDLFVINDELTWGSGLGVVGVLYEDPEWRAIPVILVCPRQPTSSPPPNVIASLGGSFAADHLLHAVRCALSSPPTSLQ